jgi:hypothetical protein
MWTSTRAIGFGACPNELSTPARPVIKRAVNWLKWTSLSLTGNILLATTAAYLLLKRPEPEPVRVSPSPLYPVHAHPPQPEPEREAPRSVPEPMPFDWSQIESPDRRVYCARLHAVGCPEKTVMDILLPIIEDDYRQRLRPLDALIPGDFWINARQRTAAHQKRSRAVRELQREKMALIQELFGRILDVEALKEWHREAALGLLLGFLPEGKPEQVLCVVKALSDQAGDIRSQAQGVFTPEDISQLSQLYEQSRQKLLPLLSPAEAEELELRMTAIGTVTVLQESVMGLAVTGSEIRQLLSNLMHAGNPVLRNLVLEINPTKSEKEQLRQAIEKQLHPILGETRFTHYQRMQDRAYQELFRFGDQHDLPLATVGRVYEIVTAVKDEETRIRKNQSLSPREREEALAQVRLDSEEALRGLVSGPVLDELKRTRRP